MVLNSSQVSSHRCSAIVNFNFWLCEKACDVGRMPEGGFVSPIIPYKFIYMSYLQPNQLSMMKIQGGKNAAWS